MFKYALILIVSFFVLFAENEKDISTVAETMVEQDTLVINSDIKTKAYPNPCDSYITIEFILKNPEFVKLRVYDFNGNLVKTVINDVKYPANIKNKVPFSTTGLAVGTYEFTIIAGGKIAAGKFIVQR